MYKVGDTFTDGDYKYEVVGIHELGYAISKRVVNESKAVPTNVKPIVEKIIEPVVIPKYTKTQINRMSTSALEELAKDLDVPVGTGAEMKKAIIELLEL